LKALCAPEIFNTASIGGNAMIRNKKEARPRPGFVQLKNSSD
jgi:hypothetical protein